MRLAAKDQLVIESAALYCSKLTTRKLPNARMKKKKKKLHECAELAQNMLFFFHQTMGTNHFLQTMQITEKNYTKNYHHKLTTKFTFAFYRLTKSFSVTLIDNISNFALSQASV